MTLTRKSIDRLPNGALMKNVEDLVSSAKTVHARYSAARMERETVREWVLGLSEYPEPYTSAVRAAKEWFKPIHPESEMLALRPDDLDRLLAVVEAGIKRQPAKTRG
jgi:hypothetical protein